jgi:hypothetical protein
LEALGIKIDKSEVLHWMKEQAIIPLEGAGAGLGAIFAPLPEIGAEATRHDLLPWPQKSKMLLADGLIFSFAPMLKR